MKEELEKLIKENFYDDHENCDDSCGKKADYTELITSIINLVDEENLKARLVELDLLEQALNDGRDLYKYKLWRLHDLETRLAKLKGESNG